MALLKQKTLSNGVSGEYWRLTSVSVCKTGVAFRVFCKLELYVNEAHKLTTPISGVSIMTSFEASSHDVAGNVVALCYEKIKEKNYPDLVGAVDA